MKINPNPTQSMYTNKERHTHMKYINPARKSKRYVGFKGNKFWKPYITYQRYTDYHVDEDGACKPVGGYLHSLRAYLLLIAAYLLVIAALVWWNPLHAQTITIYDDSDGEPMIIDSTEVDDCTWIQITDGIWECL